MGKERESLEWLAVPIAAIGLYAISFLAFTRGQKEELKKQRTDVPDKSKLEAHHITPQYQGGEDTLDNGEALTRPEHALEHFQYAQEANNRGDRNANYWAVNKIVSRMTPEELAEFNKMIRRSGG